MVGIEDIRNLVTPVLEGMEIDLVDLQLLGSGSRTILRVFVDEIGGISLQRCAEASRKISDVLDMNDPFPGKYVLEVSSPGTDRPLKTVQDFLRHKGKKVEITVGDEETENKISGVISQVKNEQVTLLAGNDKKTINLREVKLARLVVDFTS